MAPTQAARKRRGAWYTPPELVDRIVDRIVADLVADPAALDHELRVVDPACGDGRFLRAVRDRLPDRRVELVGCDIDAAALDAAGPGITAIHADALGHAWDEEAFDVVVGNPPFLSQMAADTTRGGSSRLGGGPYADAAVEFMALAIRLARPDGGRIGLVLPQSVLAARDAAPIRDRIAADADLTWSWWEPSQRHFDAKVNVCALGFRRPATGSTTTSSWTSVVTDRLGVPPIGELDTDGTVGGRAELNANFRDEYYALVPAVGDDVDGPPLVTSGLIDPGTNRWGERRVRFAKRDFERPRVDLERLTGRFPAWAERKLVPKVLVANQTRVIEAVADPDGAWLPGVPVTTLTPSDGASVWELAAVLTSPVASATAWYAAAGTGLSTTSLRIGPALLGGIPWPAGSLDRAVGAIRDGDVLACGELVDVAYGADGDAGADLLSWWAARLPA